MKYLNIHKSIVKNIMSTNESTFWLCHVCFTSLLINRILQIYCRPLCTFSYHILSFAISIHHPECTIAHAHKFLVLQHTYASINNNFAKFLKKFFKNDIILCVSFCNWISFSFSFFFLLTIVFWELHVGRCGTPLILTTTLYSFMSRDCFICFSFIFRPLKIVNIHVSLKTYEGFSGV